MPAATGTPVPPAFRLGSGAGPGASLASWRCATRLARREVRRRPGRTALVMALVLLPTLAMAVGVITARTDARWRADDFTRDAGRGADIRIDSSIDGGSGGAAPQLDDAALRSVLPPGATWTRFRSAWGAIRTTGPTGVATWAAVTDLAMAAPEAEGLVELRSGARPGPGEVVVTERLAQRLGVGVGDTLRLDRPAGAWPVVGLAVTSQGFDDHQLVFGSFDWTQVREGHGQSTVLVDLPGTTEWPAVRPLLAALGGGTARAQDEAVGAERGVAPGELRPAALAWGWVAGVLGLVAVGIVVAAAFATSARRQLVTLGQLAAQGAPGPVVRRMLALQGGWTGLLGAAAGATLGVVLTRVGKPVLEEVWGRPIDTVVVRPLDLAVIVLTGAGAATVAALVPARSAARVPVLAALSGRRPVGRVPGFLVPVGLALFGGGLGLVALAVAASRSADSNSSLVALVAIVGGLGVLFGTCCASPLVVDGVTRVVARLGGTARLAARSLARARGRSAAVATAIAVVGAVAVQATTTLATDAAQAPPEYVRYLPRNVVEVTVADDAATPVPGPIPPALLAELADILPGSEIRPRRLALPPAAGAGEPRAGVGLDGPGGVAEWWWSAPLVADDHVVDLVGLAPGDRGRLEEAGVMALLQPWSWERVDGPPSDDPTTATVPVAEGVTVDAAIPREPYTSSAAGAQVLVTPAAAADLGLVVVDAGAYVVAPTDLTDRQISRLDDLRSLGEDATFLPAGTDPTLAGAEGETVALTWEWPGGLPAPMEVLSAIVVGVALLFTLLVVAIGLSLSATESRDERDVLVAVGARPRTLRRMAGVKAVVLAGIGVAMAVPTGLAPAAVVLHDPGRPVVVPWPALALLLVVVPAAAGLLAWLSSSVAQRVHPLHASTLARD